MMTPRTCIVYGTPAPQGSKDILMIPRPGGHGPARPILRESSHATLKPWRLALAHGWRDQCPGKPFEGPITLIATFTLKRPVSEPKTRVTFPDRRPDLDKLARALLDALTAGGAWHDDGQVISMALTKTYPGVGHLSLPSPGVSVTVSQFDPG